MNHRRTAVVILSILLVAGYASAQVEAHRDEVTLSEPTCSDEVVQPNLKLSSATEFFGVIKDPTGAPFENSKIELRIQKPDGSQTPYKTVTTDKQGRFSFGTVPAGVYRLLVSPNRGFRQPELVLCPRGKCDVSLVLKVNGTDRPFANCPVR